MTFIPDLAPVSYSGLSGPVRAVGWLESPHPYSRGAVDPVFERSLRGLVQRYLNRGVPSMGMYFCSLCEAEGRLGPDGRSSQDELLVPSNGCLYEAPIWVLHYVLIHQYRPPAEFRSAVIASPPLGSEEYAAQLRPYVSSLHREMSEGFKVMGKRDLEEMLLPSAGYGTEQRWAKTVRGRNRQF